MPQAVIGMNESAGGQATDTGKSRRDYESLLVKVMAVWIGGFWLCDGFWHRVALCCLVLPLVCLSSRQLRTVVRKERWLWVASGLLAWQLLSCTWSAEGALWPDYWVGSWLDVLLTFGLLVGLLILARGKAGPVWVFR